MRGFLSIFVVAEDGLGSRLINDRLEETDKVGNFGTLSNTVQMPEDSSQSRSEDNVSNRDAMSNEEGVGVKVFVQIGEGGVQSFAVDGLDLWSERMCYWNIDE